MPIEERTVSLNTTNDTFKPEEEPFLNFDLNSELSFNDKSAIYRSLVALVKTEYPFDNALQDKVVQFLKNLEPAWEDEALQSKLISDLVPSSDGSPSGFYASILTLLSSPHSIVVTAALSFFSSTSFSPSLDYTVSLVKSDILTKVLATLQPHTLSIQGDEEMMDILVGIIFEFIELSQPSYLKELGISAAAEQYNLHEMIFQKVVLPSSQFVTFLITNRQLFNGHLFRSFMVLLERFVRICPLHRPTLEFVLASPIVMAFSSCLLFIEDNFRLWMNLNSITQSLQEWKMESPQVVQSGKRMMQALICEGFEDTLEQMSKQDRGVDFGRRLVYKCLYLSQDQGSNVIIHETFP
ncbi:hypothetical protein BLNAU_13405 [Blattamonas nauphoetae]|uniref:Uncharacterized protein n=1 Tax=Blattamonas nauphoetae TaxID=2049346 RepID=A0ABQ9XGS3_9EUKA|nr:hypothetical protein BLNAU_13405 [Blattamonas nauphoetae]